MARTLCSIADEIMNTWKNVSYGADPYLDAMFQLGDIDDFYGLDSGRSIVLYFLANSSSWRGPDARRIKAELKEMVK